MGVCYDIFTSRMVHFYLHTVTHTVTVCNVFTHKFISPFICVQIKMSIQSHGNRLSLSLMLYVTVNNPKTFAMAMHFLLRPEILHFLANDGNLSRQPQQSFT